jgi:RING-box protein 1
MSAEAAAPSTSIVTIKKWNATAMWQWDIEAEVCGICRNDINDLCIECNADGADNDCQIAWGTCNHAYHRHCIHKWLKNKQTCPMCCTPFEMTSVSSNKN